MSEKLTAIYVIKDVKFLGISQSLEIQWSKRWVDENDKIFKKINERSTIMLDGIEGSDATEKLSELIPLLVIDQAKEIGRLNSIINSMSKEVETHRKTWQDKDKIIKVKEDDIKEKLDLIVDLAQQKMVVETENERLKEEIIQTKK